MSRDKISIYELNKLIENKRATFVEYNLQTEDIKLIEEAIFKNVTLPPVYVQEDKFGVLHFDDMFIPAYLRLLKNKNYNLKELVRIEDYEFNIIVLRPNEILNISLFKKLKEKFNFF